MKQVKKDRSFNLIRWFSLLSFFSIALITAASSVLLSRFLTQNILERDAIVSMEFVQSNLESVKAAAYFESKPKGKLKTILERFFERIATMPEVVRTNVYNREGLILWSNDARFIGHAFNPNRHLGIALTGELSISSGISGRPGKGEHIFDEEVAFFSEVYIPIWNDSHDEIVGAIEVYKAPLTLFHAIERGNRLIWISEVLGGVFLFASLFWIVRRAALLIQDQQARLVGAETMATIGEMSSVVAHGIRNPLASIRSSAEMALDENQLITFKRSASDIIGQADRLEDWIRELLTYSRPTQNKLTLAKIDEMIRAALTSLNHEIEKYEIQVALDLEATPRMYVDEPLLTHALINLMSNAIDAMPNGGFLNIQNRRIKKSSQMEITIKDTGSGIAADKMDKVLKPFFTIKPKGLGVGLSLTQRIVERHRGTMHLSSQEGKGTTVTLQIPISR